MAENSVRQNPKKSFIRRVLSALGPGVITGAADDDPSGIATYSIAGAQLGTSLLWTSIITWPLMGAVQMMCARIGMVTGLGLGGALRQKIPRGFLIIGCLALLIANTINIGADFAGMADAAQILTGIDSHYWVVFFGIGISWAIIRLRYHQIASVLKWLALVLLAYVITAFLVTSDWNGVLKDAFIPKLPTSHSGWATLVAILGTTISPYLFFWQSAQEVEEEKSKGRRMLIRRQGASSKEIVDRVIDVSIGTFFSNIVMFFIILTTALTLHSRGIVINSSKEAALALEPLAGHLAVFLYTIGIVGVGALAIPTLAGSAAYAFAETFDWVEGLDEKFRQAVPFYGVVILATTCGICLDFMRINPVDALYWAAIINGLLAPFLIIGILLVASDSELMQRQPSSWINRATVFLTMICMFAAGFAMIWL